MHLRNLEEFQILWFLYITILSCLLLDTGVPGFPKPSHCRPWWQTDPLASEVQCGWGSQRQAEWFASTSSNWETDLRSGGVGPSSCSHDTKGQHSIWISMSQIMARKKCSVYLVLKSFISIYLWKRKSGWRGVRFWENFTFFYIKVAGIVTVTWPVNHPVTVNILMYTRTFY